MLVLLLVLGLVLLVVGGEALVRGAGGLARAFGLSPLVIGLTVVAAATSAPELSVTLTATLDGAPGLAVGNVVGSNIANVLLVLGAAALIAPLVVGRSTMRVDLPVVVALSVLTWVLTLDGTVSRWEGGLLLVLLVAYVVYSVVASRAASGGGEEETAPGDGSRSKAFTLVRDAVLVAVGVGMLVGGAQALVFSASAIAADLGVSDLVVGLTVVAIGTSLPELATSVVAVARGHTDLAIGNVVGSNLFNIGTVLGTTGLLTPGGVPVEASSVRVDLPVMIAVVVVLMVLAFAANRLSRRDGLLLLLGYAAYLAYLVLDARGSDVLGAYLQVLGVVGALAVVAMVAAVALEVRGRRRVRA
ncbi:calcium/sodium antiporter [Pseudokineococcus sp. 1T1Z-3]|uniref:calcium/sodium antiporter n=1 Tax=Pseudokineococcus sp. 1T1Z-3 TaxID=3132745 RepID=UPI0030B1A661